MQPPSSPDDRLNVYYMVLEKLSSFTEGKYDTSPSFQDIAADFETKRSDALQQIEDMAITKRIISTCMRRPHSSVVRSV
jgi:amphiphysin